MKSTYCLEIKLLIFSEDAQISLEEETGNCQDQDVLSVQAWTFYSYRFPSVTPAEHRHKGYPIETPTPPEEWEHLMRMFNNTPTVSFIILLPLAHQFSSWCQDEQAVDLNYQDDNLEDFIVVSNLKWKHANQQDEATSEHGSDFNSGINKDGEMVETHQVMSKVNSLLFSFASPSYSIILDVCHCSQWRGYSLWTY